MSLPGSIEYADDRAITAAAFVDVLRRSTLAARRPVDDPACIEAMVAGADLTVTAWQGETLVGVARSVTDFDYCCYLSDLAVDERLQRQGVGLELIRRTRARLGSRCKLILLAAPAAVAYYPKLGFRRHESAWILDPADPLRP